MVYTVVENKLFLAESNDDNLLEQTNLLPFTSLYKGDDHTTMYYGIAKLSNIIRFIQALDAEIGNFDKEPLSICCDEHDPLQLTKAVFLLGAYLILKHRMQALRVLKCFAWFDQTRVRPFPDLSGSPGNAETSLTDCWGALEKGRAKGWLRFEGVSATWGAYNVNEYEHYDDEANGALHVVVPGKVLAFRAPRDLRGYMFHDDDDGVRTFSPGYFVDIFRALHVTAVVRIDNADYEESAFELAGFTAHSLDWPNHSFPPPDRTVVDFLHMAASARRGLLALHCPDGFHRCGTLAARYLMRFCGFTAREAVCWLRIVRPGAVAAAHLPHLLQAEASEAGAEAAWPRAAEPAPTVPAALIPRPVAHYLAGGHEDELRRSAMAAAAGEAWRKASNSVARPRLSSSASACFNTSTMSPPSSPGGASARPRGASAPCGSCDPLPAIVVAGRARSRHSYSLPQSPSSRKGRSPSLESTEERLQWAVAAAAAAAAASRSARIQGSILSVGAARARHSLQLTPLR